jgi:hypothetical protein
MVSMHMSQTSRKAAPMAYASSTTTTIENIGALLSR